MDLKEIKQVLKLMDMHGLTEFRLERDDEKILLKRQSNEVIAMPQNVALQPIAQTPTVAAQGVAPAPPESQAEKVDDSLQVITSPMVGTFYAASSPESDTFTSVGKTVGPDSTVCIVEAMKIMNEIKAEISGTIEQICVQNGQPVEFGQELFKVRV